ncbi:EARP-interacting protein homolog isoform X2 [Oscarella lobularis]|uniref:EARP-interacting protein homolog isoform X2 n=1 Tax=Oscarella lobularis TaxID=121494 RepID=UPI003313E6DA
MDDDSPVIYGLESQGRAISARTAETDEIHYFVGTQSLRSDNQVHLLEFDDETHYIEKKVFGHPNGEIWQLSCSPKDRDLLSTSHSQVKRSKLEYGATLWQIPDSGEEGDGIATNRLPSTGSASGTHLKNVMDLEGHKGPIKSVLWHPGGDNQIVSIDDHTIHLWDIDSAKVIDTASLESKTLQSFYTGKWNPHQNCHQVMTAVETSLKGWDLRTMKPCWDIEHAHQQQIRDLDFNPNRQYYFVTCGDDCSIRFWDVRNTSAPLQIRKQHSHWIWCVCYNHFHDQLVLSSSSDSNVILCSIPSLSSEPLGHIDDDEEKESSPVSPPKDCLVSTYDEHEDSVYSVAWSTADPWIFASLSYDGRVVINHVPRKEKFKILL